MKTAFFFPGAPTRSSRQAAATQPHALACAVLCLLGAPVLAPALAQTPAVASSTAATASANVVVTGQRASLRKAQAAQEAANHVLSVVSADDIGALPDKNAAEALARLPGVSVQRDQGEGRYVVIRGLGPDLNSVTINGALVPAPEAGRRGVALDTLPTGMVRSLEISKTLTPDRDANSLGGTIEVKTLSAFDLPGSLLAAGIGGSHDQNIGKASPAANLLWASRFDGGRLGVALGASIERRKFGSDNVETGGAWNAGRLTGFELRDYLPVRERDAVSANLDYRPQPGTAFTLRSFLSRFSDDEVRDRLTIGNVANTAATPGGSFAEGQTVTARAERRVRERKNTQEISSVVLGGETRLSDWLLSAALGSSSASEDTPESLNDGRFRQNGVAGVSFSNSQLPLPSGPASLTTPASYALNAITLQARISKDSEAHAKFDLSRPLNLGAMAAELKFGAKASQRKKSNDTNVWAYNSNTPTSANFWGPGSTSMSGFVKGDVDFPLGPLGPGLDPRLIRERVAALPRDPARLLRESTINDYRMNEDINAAYLQASVDILPHWNVLAGLRAESTTFQARGFSISPAGAVLDVLRERKHTDWLPGLHTRFDIDQRTTLRAAWSNSVVRANFSQLSPGINLASATEATIGNPDLKPLRSANFDLGVERLLGNDGSVSIYAFAKDIKDYTYTTNLAGTGAWTGYSSAVSFANGDKARVSGVELAYTQALRFLPGALSGVIVGANATLTRSSASVARFDTTARAVLARDIRLPGQSDTVFNLMLGYEGGPLSARLALNQKSPYLLELGADILNASQERIVDRQRQLDLRVGWQLNKQFQLVFEGLNLNHEKYYVYQGSKPFNVQFEQYGRTLKIGLNASIF